MNNRFKNLVELKNENNEDTYLNKKENNTHTDTNTGNIFLKSETKYFQNKRKKENSFSKKNEKKERYNTFTRKFQNERKKQEPEKKKIDINNNDDFPPLQ